MSELRETIRRAADRHEPPEDWFERIHERARTKRRNRRVAAGLVGLGLSLVLVIALAGQFRTWDRTEPGGTGPSPATRCGIGINVSPTGWWRADGSPADAVGGRDGVLRGGAAYAPGIIGQAFALAGKGDFVEVPDDPALNVGSQDFTVSLWVRFTTTKGNQTLVEDYIETFDRGTATGWIFEKFESNEIVFGLGRAGGTSTPSLEIPTETWIHLAARREGDYLSILMDGKLISRNALRHPRRGNDSDSSLKFGHRGSPKDTPGSLDRRGFFLRGSLDEIALFVGRGLSDAQIRRIFEAQSACAT